MAPNLVRLYNNKNMEGDPQPLHKAAEHLPVSIEPLAEVFIKQETCFNQSRSNSPIDYTFHNSTHDNVTPPSNAIKTEPQTSKETYNLPESDSLSSEIQHLNGFHGVYSLHQNGADNSGSVEITFRDSHCYNEDIYVKQEISDDEEYFEDNYNASNIGENCSQEESSAFDLSNNKNKNSRDASKTNDSNNLPNSIREAHNQFSLSIQSLREGNANFLLNEVTSSRSFRESAGFILSDFASEKGCNSDNNKVVEAGIGRFCEVNLSVKQECEYDGDEGKDAASRTVGEPEKTVKMYRQAAGVERLDDNKHRCRYCGTVFTSEAYLPRHLSRCKARNIHDTLINRQAFTQPVTSVEDNTTAGKPKKNLRHTCHLCPYTSRTMANLSKHVDNHQRDRTLKCELCGYVCVQPSAMRKHKVIHSQEKPFSCQHCEFRSNHFNNLKSHQLVHTGIKPFACDKCAYTCASSSDLNKHKRVHSGEKRFACDVCSYTCDQSVRLRDHKLIHLGKKPFACDKCDYSCIKVFHLNTHKEFHHAEEKSFTCDECGYTYTSSRNLQQYKLVHVDDSDDKSGDASPAEKDDEESFASKQHVTLKNHKFVYSGNKPFHCDECSNSYRVSTALKIHKRTHEGDNPFVCDQCPYTFKAESTLKRHRRIHVGKRTFSCAKCNFTYIASRNLKHYRLVHNETTPSVFSECGTTVKLENHELVYSPKKPFACDECDEAYTILSALKRHKFTHTGEKYQSCDKCSYTCANLSRLKLHQRVHSGDNLFSCDKCEFSCRRSNKLKRHATMVHAHAGENNVEAILS